MWACRAAGDARTIEQLVGEIEEELNVKELKIVTANSDLVDVIIHPLPAQLGRKYGRRFPAIRQALQAIDPLAVAADVEAGRPVAVAVEDERLQILPEEIEIRKSPKHGLAVAEEAGYLVAVTTELTDELRWEGYAREIARNIQVLRKDSSFEISDRIDTTVQSGPRLAPVWEHYGDAIAADTLSLSLHEGPPAPGAATATVSLEGEEVLVGITRVQR